MRSLLVLGVAAVGATSLSSTIANVLVRPNPAIAHALPTVDGRVVAALAREEFSSAPDSSENSKQAQLAARALRLEATAVEALNVLAMQAEMRAEPATVDLVFDYSFALSRRELQPQLWAIEEAVRRGDIEGALNNYDLAFRTSVRAQQTLFPILTSALAEAKIRRVVLSLLAKKPDWTNAFLHYASARERDSVAVAKLFREGAGRLPLEEAQRARVVNGLIAQGLVKEAWRFFVTFRPGATLDRSRDPGFELRTAYPSAFDWTVGASSGLNAAIVHGASASHLEFSAPPSSPAVVVTQTQLLPPGVYRLVGESAEIDQPERSLPYWILNCGDGAELGRVNVPNSMASGGRYSGEIVVPPGCPVQILSLMIRASDTSSGVVGKIKRIQLVPAR